MKIKEVIGILVLECHCGQQFVVNTEAVKNGFQLCCSCGRGNWRNSGSRIEVTIHQNPHGNNKGLGKESNAMPLEEYKVRLAEKFLGKNPKVPTKHKSVVSFEDNGVNVATIAKTLESLGYSKNEIMGKIDVAVKDGFFHEEEIIKYILGGRQEKNENEKSTAVGKPKSPDENPEFRREVEEQRRRIEEKHRNSNGESHVPTKPITVYDLARQLDVDVSVIRAYIRKLGISCASNYLTEKEVALIKEYEREKEKWKKPKEASIGAALMNQEDYEKQRRAKEYEEGCARMDRERLTDEEEKIRASRRYIAKGFGG